MLPTYCRRSYASYNYSAPRLPKGLKFSSALRAVTYQVFDANGLYVYESQGVNYSYYWNLGDATYPGLSCPYIIQVSNIRLLDLFC